MLFREGPAAIALMAAKKADRPVVCVPCAIKYRYVEDPTPELTRLMAQLERALYWQPRPDLTLPQRIYHLAEGMLALKEIEILGSTQAGRLPERIRSLIEFVLCRIEGRYAVDPRDAAIPERVKTVRRMAIERLAALAADEPGREQFLTDLDDVLLVVQGFSYPGNYVSQRPSIERIAETLDKFEEDVLGRSTATVRGTRKAIVTFGEPIIVDRTGEKRDATAGLTRLLEQQVQRLLDETA
jgi:hypothetical protein